MSSLSINRMNELAYLLANMQADYDNEKSKLESNPPKYLYHGTVDMFLPDILKNGLRPVAENKWDITMHNFFNDYNPRIDDPDGYVYVTPVESRAKAFAKARADYYKTKPGAKFDMFDGVMEATKALTAPTFPKVKPVVVRIDATSELILKLEDDPRASRALRLKGSIEPSIIHPIKEYRSVTHEQTV